MMQAIKAIFLTHHVNDWLVETSLPRILHVFDNVCNLVNERREVLSIVTAQIGNGPFNLVVGNDVLFSEQVDLESQISLSPTEITLGNITVSITKAKLWNPRPNWKQLHEKRNDIFHRLNSISIPKHKLSIPGSLLSIFTTSVGSVDISTSISAAQKLAGLGVGLTPEGDDFIMGALHAAWIIHPHKIASQLALEIAEIAAPLTTTLSAAWIRSAGRGNAGIVWHVFFEDLISGNTFRIQRSSESILAIGETSGADALTGFVRGFMSQMQS